MSNNTKPNAAAVTKIAEAIDRAVETGDNDREAVDSILAICRPYIGKANGAVTIMAGVEEGMHHFIANNKKPEGAAAHAKWATRFRNRTNRLNTLCQEGGKDGAHAFKFKVELSKENDAGQMGRCTLDTKFKLKSSAEVQKDKRATARATRDKLAKQMDDAQVQAFADALKALGTSRLSRDFVKAAVEAVAWK